MISLILWAIQYCSYFIGSSEYGYAYFHNWKHKNEWTSELESQDDDQQK